MELHKVDANFDGLPRIELSFDLADIDRDWVLKSRNNDQLHYTAGSFTLDIRLDRKGQQKVLHIKLAAENGKELSVSSYNAKVSLLLKDAHAVMVPNTRKIAHTLIYYHEHRTWPENPKIYRCLLPEGFTEPAPTTHEAPYILLTDNKGNNALSVGWAVADRCCSLQGETAGESYALDLLRKEDQPFKGTSLEDALIISTSSEPWMEVEEGYAMTFDAYNKRPVRSPAPDWTSDPVFCTWYCYDDHIDQEGVLKIARKCKELGFRTILIDAGWDARPDMGFGDFEDGVLGDYIAMPDRFPDLAGAVREMHEMGLRVELWAGPFWEGKKSKAYQEKTGGWHIHNKEGELHELCPKHPGTRRHFKESFARVAKTYKIDGMWLDAADSVPMECLSDHEHLDQPMGEAFVDCLAAIRDGLRSVNPEAVTEARVLHANLNTKRAFDLVQPSDAPKSYEFLRLAAIHIRPWVYDIVLKNDPMNWRKETDPVTVAKFLATMVCNGVPALSVDFLTAPEEQCKLTNAWLKFYKQHKKTLLKGQFSLFGEDFGSPDMMLTGSDEVVVYLQNPRTHEVRLPKRFDKIILLNCTNSDHVELSISNVEGKHSIQAYNLDWSESSQAVTLDSSGTLKFSGKVPQGGSAVIKVLANVP